MENADIEKVGGFLRKIAYVWSLYPSETFGSIVRALDLHDKNMNELVKLIDEARANSKTEGKDT